MQSGGELIQGIVRGALGQPHVTLEGGGHSLQEDAGVALAKTVIDFIRP